MAREAAEGEEVKEVRGVEGDRGKKIFAESGVVEEGAGGFDFGVHVGEHPLDGLKLADGFAEGFAGARVLHGFIEGALGQAYGLGGNADAAAVEGRESDLQAGAFVAETIFLGDRAVVEDEFD